MKWSEISKSLFLQIKETEKLVVNSEEEESI